MVMMTKKHELDMTQGSISKSIIRFSIPLIFSSLLQLLYNAADLIVVSRFAGSSAMGSVGATTSLNALLVNLCMGISIGAAVLVSRHYGAHNREGLRRSVHTAMLLSAIMGICTAVLGLLLARPVLELMGTPEEVIDGSVTYISIIWAALPATMVYNYGAAILRAVGDTKRPLYILAMTGIVNVILNLVLVIVFHLDVAGVAISTAFANLLSAMAVVYALMHSNGDYRLDLKQLRLYREELKEILRVGAPAGIQSSLFSLSNSVVLSAVNGFGADTLTGYAAASNIEGFVYVGMDAFHQATLTAVSQNYGAKNTKRINRTIWVSTICVSVVGALLGGLCVLFARPLLKIYITDSESAIAEGVIRIAVTCASYFLCGIMNVLTGTIRGLGSSTITAINSLVGACGFRIFWVYCILPFHRTTGFLYLCWPFSWIFVIILHLITLAIVKKRAFARLATEE